MAIREQMCTLGILLKPSVDGAEVFDWDNAKKVRQFLTKMHMTYTWINVDNAEDIMVCKWYAQGKDSDEKGVGKGLTYGEKFFLLKFFNIATGKHDPDAQQGAEHEQKKSTPTQQAPPVQPPSKPASKARDPHYVSIVMRDETLGGIVQAYTGLQGLTGSVKDKLTTRAVLRKLWRKSGGLETAKAPSKPIKDRFTKAIKEVLTVENTPDKILASADVQFGATPKPKPEVVKEPPPTATTKLEYTEGDDENLPF